MRCSNLPSQLSSFIGREREIATANRLLHQTRLLTLTGPGGCGKTRLALAVAEGLVRKYPDGAWLVELASVSDPELAPQAVASALELRETPGRPLLDTLKTYLRNKRMLLLLDNCEHLIEACAELAHALLTACPGLRILATSREPLHVTGETIWTVPPLTVPQLEALPPVEALRRIEAVRLFVERAGHITPGFALSRQNALPISQICSWLVGSPLAIELAAARTRVLAPEQIAARLGDALAFLATADRTVPARHRTLQATLDWSYDLLSPGEQVLFRRLSVFTTSFSVEAAEAICAGDEWRGSVSPRSGSVLDLLGGLVDKSLLEVEGEAEAERRFHYLEPVRQYALSKLCGAGDEDARARDQLLTWAVTLTERVGALTHRSGAKRHLEQLETEYANLRAALEWGSARSAGDVEQHRLVHALTQFWQARGYICEGLGWCEQLLASPDGVPIPMEIDALHDAAFIAVHARDFARTRRYLERGIGLAKANDERHRLAILYTRLAWLESNEGAVEAADRLCAEALQLAEESGDLWCQSQVLFIRANNDYLRQNYARARRGVEESIAITKSLDYALALARRLVRLAQLCLLEGDLDAAECNLNEGMRLSHENGDRWGAAMAVASLAALAQQRGQHERAAWLLGVTQHLRDFFGVPMWAVDEAEYNQNFAELRLLLGEARFRDAMDRGAGQAARDLEHVLETLLHESEQVESTAHAVTRRAAATSAAQREFAELSSREREVAALIAQGKSNAEIAATLYVGLRTVEAHVTHILNKLGFNSRSQIAAWMAAQSTLASTELPER